VLPEALVNYLALLGWAPTGGTREIFSLDELVREFDLKRVTPSPAVFDTEKLHWLNRHYMKEASPERIRRLALAYHARSLVADMTKKYGNGAPGTFSGQDLVTATNAWATPPNGDWLGRLTDVLLPYVDRLEQLPERARMIFHYDAPQALRAPDNAEVLSAPKTAAVLESFAHQIETDDQAQRDQLTPERFKAMINQVKAETGAKGRELFHPIRVAITGTHSGPEFDKLVPIIEDGSRLMLPRVASVRQRVQAFMEAREKLTTDFHG
jgi:nondiscriminating glutamyl-tRNA synthetase